MCVERAKLLALLLGDAPIIADRAGNAVYRCMRWQANDAARGYTTRSEIGPIVGERARGGIVADHHVEIAIRIRRKPSDLVMDCAGKCLATVVVGRVS